MMESMIILEVVVVLLLIFECWILHIWAKQHADLMSIISFHVAEIKKKLDNPKN